MFAKAFYPAELFVIIEKNYELDCMSYSWIGKSWKYVHISMKEFI